MSTVHYSVQIEFKVDSVLDGGPTRADIRRDVKRYVEGLTGCITRRWVSLRDVHIKYLHEATSTQFDRKRHR